GRSRSRSSPCREHTGSVLFADLATASRVVSSTSKRSEKVAILAAVLRRAAPDEIPAAVAFASGTSLHGRLGVGCAPIADVRPEPAAVASLEVLDVHRALTDLLHATGSGSVARRRAILSDLLERAAEPEQHLIRGVLGGELRQGALDG